MKELIVVFLFLIGLAFGSFLNVIILRYKPDGGIFDNIFGRSYCPHCKRNLRWYELIPLVSFLIQWGKCRSCGQGLSIQYPLVELLIGLIFILVPLSFSSGAFNIFGKAFYPSFIFTPKQISGGVIEELFLDFIWILVFLILIVVSIIDFRLQIIPDILNVFLLTLGISALAGRFYFLDFGLTPDNPQSFLGTYAMMLRFNDNLLFNYFLGAVLGVSFFGLLYFITRGFGIGFGDVKLALPLGLLFGYPDIVVIAILSFIIGAIFGLYLIFTGRKRLQDHLAFAPFMALAVTLVFFFGYHIIDVYFRVFRF